MYGHKQANQHRLYPPPAVARLPSTTLFFGESHSMTFLCYKCFLTTTISFELLDSTPPLPSTISTYLKETRDRSSQCEPKQAVKVLLKPPSFCLSCKPLFLKHFTLDYCSQGRLPFIYKTILHVTVLLFPHYK